MKTVRNLLIVAATLLAAYTSTASAQCYSGYDYYSPKAVSRFYQFQLDGRGFAFDRVTGDIFCGTVKIGVRTPDGRVNLLPDAAARIGGAPAGGVVAGQPAVAGQPGVAGGAALGGVAAPGGTPAVGGAAPAGATPAGAAPAGAPATDAPAAPPAQGAAPAGNGDAVPAAPAPTATAATDTAIPVLGNNPGLPAPAAIDPALLTGQWRVEGTDVFGRSVIRELSFDEDKKVTFRVQAQGDEPQVIEGAFEIKEGKMTVTQDEENRELGQISAENGQLIIKRDNETLTFKRIEE
jgi:hypothetical protein